MAQKITLNVDEELLKEIDEAMEEMGFVTRAGFIRYAIKKVIKEVEKE